MSIKRVIRKARNFLADVSYIIFIVLFIMLTILSIPFILLRDRAKKKIKKKEQVVVKILGFQSKVKKKCPKCKGRLWTGLTEGTLWCDKCGEIKK